MPSYPAHLSCEPRVQQAFGAEPGEVLRVAGWVELCISLSWAEQELCLVADGWALAAPMAALGLGPGRCQTASLDPLLDCGFSIFIVKRLLTIRFNWRGQGQLIHSFFHLFIHSASTYRASSQCQVRFGGQDSEGDAIPALMQLPGS